MGSSNKSILNYVDKKSEKAVCEGHRSEIKIRRARTREI